VGGDLAVTASDIAGARFVAGGDSVRLTEVFEVAA